MTNNEHTHIYDEYGKQICCSLEEKNRQQDNTTISKL